MIEDIILRDTEIIKLKILKLLINLPNHAISSKDVTKQTGVSSFRLQNLIEELDNEINYHIEDAKVSFEYDNNYLVEHNLTITHLRLLRLEYIVNSNSFKILRYNQFENNQVSLQDFLGENGIGQPNYYHLRKELEPVLERKHVFAEVPTYIDNFEYVKRRKLAGLFYSYYEDMRDPFPEVSETVDLFIKMIDGYMPVELSQANTAKLRICISIQLMRIKNNNFLKNYSVPMSLKIEKLTEKFAEVFQSFCDNTGIDLQAEALFLLSVCYSQIVVKEPEKYQDFVEFSAHVQKKNQSLYGFIDRLLRENAVNKQVNESTMDQKINYILRLNEWLLIFDLGFTKNVSDEVYYNLVSQYPQRSLVSDEYVDKLVTTFNMEIEEETRKYLRYHYLIGFMQVIPDDSIDKNVNIALDFTNSFAYSDYVTKVLQRYPSVHIDENVVEHTDIYLTDTYSSYVKIPQIIWPNLPEKAELQKFEKIIQTTQYNKIKIFN